MKLTVLTTTYNRCRLLTKLYDSLKNQECKEFRWLIVDDGSEDRTEAIVKDWMKSEDCFEIKYVKKINGGKSQAVNVGLSECLEDDFVLIIDDDEILYKNALSIVRKYVKKYLVSECVGIEFLRNGDDGKPIANYDIAQDFYMTVQERKRRNYQIDGYAGYFVKRLGDNRFPEFKNERYVGPGVLQMLVSKNRKYKLLWPNAILGETEYLQGGITRQGRKLRVKNPKGMVVYCGLMQTDDAGLKVRLKYSIMGYAYLFLAKISSNEVFPEFADEFIRITKVLGWTLGCYWKIKYLNDK